MITEDSVVPASVKKPASISELDFELEVACVIGREVQDVRGERAEEAIFGYLILNDWSARDMQREEMKCSLGPAKGKDFATSVGPWVATKDELADRRLGPGQYDLTMLARKKRPRDIARQLQGPLPRLHEDDRAGLARCDALPRRSHRQRHRRHGLHSRTRP